VKANLKLMIISNKGICIEKQNMKKLNKNILIFVSSLKRNQFTFLNQLKILNGLIQVSKLQSKTMLKDITLGKVW
jgi:uncharacterized hydantoinase/oxoprolinase family protein